MNWMKVLVCVISCNQNQNMKHYGNWNVTYHSYLYYVTGNIIQGYLYWFIILARILLTFFLITYTGTCQNVACKFLSTFTVPCVFCIT